MCGVNRTRPHESMQQWRRASCDVCSLSMNRGDQDSRFEGQQEIGDHTLIVKGYK